MSFTLRTLTICGLLGIFCLVLSSANAAPLNFSTKPLYLGTTAEPNILFLIDDSGSMDWESMTKDYSNSGRFTANQPNGVNDASAGSVKHRDGDNNGSANCGFGTNGQDFYGYIYGVEFARNIYGDDSNDCNTADDEEWRFRNSNFNPLYFDPTKTYEPWAGLNKSGIAYNNMPITAALADPYDPASEVINLSQDNSNYTAIGTGRTTADRNGDGQPDGFRYYTWADSNNNGKFDNGEQSEHFIKNESAAMQQNFANWFSYYRSRHLIAKAAYGKVISQGEGVRMGLVTLHNNNAVNKVILSMNSDPNSGNKKALLDALYSFKPGNATPLRAQFLEACKYLDCAANSMFASCPRLETANGGQCQQNFLVMMTDGFYNDTYTSLANEDGDKSSIWDGGAFADTYKYTLADIAMYYYERDIHPDIVNSVPVLQGIDNATHQHVVTYGVAFGLDGTLTAMPTDSTKAFTWPNPTTSEAHKIDDLRHAAYNGRGKFLSASNAQTLIDSLDDAIGDIGKRTSSAAAVALNSASLETNTTLYQARFDSGNWSGQLLYYGLKTDGSLSSPLLDAGEVLESKTATSRVILTFNSQSAQGVAFRWANLATAQKTFLNTDPDNSANDNEGSQRLDFLRGDATNENTGLNYRDRSRKLGDIVYSSPIHVGAPDRFYSANFESASYVAFRENHDDSSERRPMIYVGANDGMLHGFDAATGEELIAYVPNVVYGNLSALTSKSYTHRYYVDGTPSVGDVFFSSGQWKTILVGSSRAGGKAYFALDITKPNSFSEATASNLVLWEKSATDDPDIGYSYSEANIVKLHNNQWGVIMGNGYNSCNPNPVLLILNAQTGNIITKINTNGNNYAKTAWTTATCTESASYANGLITPAVIDKNGDRIADYAYAGDLNGNMWRFDLTDANAANWKVSFNGNPLFSAKDSLGAVQPITTRPMVGFQTENSTTGYNGMMLYFGTGKYMEKTDNNPTGAQTQTFYGIWDHDVKDNANNDIVYAIGRSGLLQQKILAEVALASGQTSRLTSDESDNNVYKINWITQHGWYMDLYNTESGNTDNKGERQISHALLSGQTIKFSTLIPNTEICGFGGGGFLMELDARDGSRLDYASLDVNDDGIFSTADLIAVSEALIKGSGTGSLDLYISGVGTSNGGIPSAPTFLRLSQPSSTTTSSNNTGSNLSAGWSKRHEPNHTSEQRVYISDTKGAVTSRKQNNLRKRLGRLNWQHLP